MVDKACENGRVRKEVEMLYKNVWIELEARLSNDFHCFDHSAIWGEHPGVYTIVYEHKVHLTFELYFSVV